MQTIHCIKNTTAECFEKPTFVLHQSRRKMIDISLYCRSMSESICTQKTGQKVSVPSQESRVKTHIVCLLKFLCVSPWGQSKHSPLSCVALRNYGQFWAPGWLGRWGGAPRLSLKLPICFFPHCRLAKQHDPPPLPWVRSLSTPGQLWSDGQKKPSERALGTLRLVHVCVMGSQTESQGDGWGHLRSKAGVHLAFAGCKAPITRCMGNLYRHAYKKPNSDLKFFEMQNVICLFFHTVMCITTKRFICLLPPYPFKTKNIIRYWEKKSFVFSIKL